MKHEIDQYLNAGGIWQHQLEALRSILLDSDLVETYKWQQPCYTKHDKNIVILHKMKDYCALGFFKGSLIDDRLALLIKPGKNTNAGRQMRFTTLDNIYQQEDIIKDYIRQAIYAEQSPQVIAPTGDLVYPEEFHKEVLADPTFGKAFSALTPGRQRGYHIFWTAAKQSATVTSRITKQISRIKDGYGIHDCTCGLSQKMPRCDGSHKGGRRISK